MKSNPNKREEYDEMFRKKDKNFKCIFMQLRQNIF